MKEATAVEIEPHFVVSAINDECNNSLYQILPIEFKDFLGFGTVIIGKEFGKIRNIIDCVTISFSSPQYHKIISDYVMSKKKYHHAIYGEVVELHLMIDFEELKKMNENVI